MARKQKTAAEMEQEARQLLADAKRKRREDAAAKEKARVERRAGLGTRIMDDLVGVQHDDEGLVMSAIIEVLSRPDVLDHVRSEVQRLVHPVDNKGGSADEDASTPEGRNTDEDHQTPDHDLEDDSRPAPATNEVDGADSSSGEVV